MNRMFRSVSVFAIGFFAFGALLFFSSSKTPGTNQVSNDKTVQAQENALPQTIHAIKVPGDANLAGEYVPLHNFDAKERLDRELMVNSYWHSSTLHNIKMATRYFPVIEPILAEMGVPDDFKYLAVAESSLRNATSPAGAKGIWQFMPATAKGYGMTVNTEIDERYNVEKSTRAACKYLKNAYNRFGSWTLAASSYNAGEGRISKLLSTQKQQSYYDLEMNNETGRYVFRIIAIKEILSNPTLYGFYVDYEDKYPPLDQFSVVEVNAPVADWADFANQYGVSYRMLKVYNPWLRASKLSSTGGKSYQVKLHR